MQLKSRLLAAAMLAGAVMLASSAIAQAPDPVGDQVLALDSSRVEAWKQKNWKLMAPMIADNVSAFSMTVIPQEASGRAAFMDWVAHQDFPATETIKKFPEAQAAYNQNVRIVGTDRSVAFVTGVLVDGADPTDQGESYAAIYYKPASQWQLLRYSMTVNGKFVARDIGLTVPPPGALNGSLDGLSPDGKQIAEKMNLFHDFFARHLETNFPQVFSDGLIYQQGGGALETLPSLTERRIHDLGKGPELVKAANPKVLLLGKSQDVAVMTNVRSDADGGGAWGWTFTPVWRTYQHELSLWDREGAGPDSWKMVLYYAGRYVAKPVKPNQASN